MSWRHGHCECCGEDCVVDLVERTCTIVGDGPCPPVDCDACVSCDAPAKIRFGTPDLVSGRTIIEDVDTYPDGEAQFRFRGGKILTIFGSTRTITCGGRLFFLTRMSVSWGCPETPGYQTQVFPSRRADIDLPNDCTGCVIRIRLHYNEGVGDDCEECLDVLGECAAIVTFDDVGHPLDDTSSGAVNTGDPSTIACEVLLGTCPDVFPCISYGELSESAWSAAKGSLAESLPIKYDSACGLETAPPCADYGADYLSPEDLFCDGFGIGGIANILWGASINRYFACQLVVTDPGQLAFGVIHGYIVANGDAVMGASVSIINNLFPVEGRIMLGTMGGTYRFPPTDPDTTNLGTFNPALNGDFCRAMIEILSRRYDLTNAIPGRPGWGVTIE